jgi:hypothetical protein
MLKAQTGLFIVFAQALLCRLSAMVKFYLTWASRQPVPRGSLPVCNYIIAYQNRINSRSSIWFWNLVWQYTRSTTQGCNSILISWPFRTCWNNLAVPATSLIISTRLLQLLTACSILEDNLGQAVRTQLVDGLLADLLQDVRFLRVCIRYKFLCMSNRLI